MYIDFCIVLCTQDQTLCESRFCDHDVNNKMILDLVHVECTLLLSSVLFYILVASVTYCFIVVITMSTLSSFCAFLTLLTSQNSSWKNPNRKHER